MKVKLDAKNIKELTLEHIEKIGLGVVALIALMMIYSAFSNAQSTKKTPDQLRQAADEADRKIESTEIDDMDFDELKVTDYTTIAIDGRARIEETEYLTPHPLDPRLFEQKPKRTKPLLLAATQLRGKADFGAVTEKVVVEPEAAPGIHGNMDGMRGNAATSEVRGERWVAVTALVPIKNQEQAYIDAFRNCVFPTQNDIPTYLGYWVERVEVPGPIAPVDIDWSKAQTFQSSKAVSKAQEKWGQTSSGEIVEQKYLHQRLVFPLPPLVGKQWDKDIAHDPEVPLPSLEPGMGTLPRGGMEEGMLGGRGNMRGGPRGMGPGGLGQPGAQPDFDDPFNPTQPTDPTTGPNNIADQNKLPAHLLLRFMDFDVKPGKYYVYRVQIALKNPNCGLKPPCLENPKLAKASFLKTKWSDPTSVVSVPRDTQVLAVSVLPAKPLGRVMIAKWVQRRGFMAHEEFSVERGQVLDYADKTFRRVEGGAARGVMGGMEGMMGPGMMPPEPGMEGMRPPGRRAPARPRAGRRDAPRRGPDMGGMPGDEMGMGGLGRPWQAMPAQPGNEWLVNYYANAIAIDFRGGESLTSKPKSDFTSIGEILLFDADGNLVVHNELDDQPERDKIAAAANPANPVPGGHPVPGVGPRGALDGLFQRDPNEGNRRRR